MAVNPAGARGIAERACACPDMPGARTGRDFGAVIFAALLVGGPWTW